MNIEELIEVLLDYQRQGYGKTEVAYSDTEHGPRRIKSVLLEDSSFGPGNYFIISDR